MVWSSAAVPMSRRRLRTSGVDGSLRGTGVVLHTPNCWPIRRKNPQLVLRETAFVHKEYREYIKLTHSSIIHSSSDCRRCSAPEASDSLHPPHVPTSK